MLPASIIHSWIRIIIIVRNTEVTIAAVPIAYVADAAIIKRANFGILGFKLFCKHFRYFSRISHLKFQPSYFNVTSSLIYKGMKGYTKTDWKTKW